MANSSVDLPQPDSPTTPTNSPGVHVEVDVVDRDDRRRAPVSYSTGEVTDLKHRRATGHARLASEPAAARGC